MKVALNTTKQTNLVSMTPFLLHAIFLKFYNFLSLEKSSIFLMPHSNKDIYHYYYFDIFNVCLSIWNRCLDTFLSIFVYMKLLLILFWQWYILWNDILFIRAGIKPFQSARSVLEPLVTTDTDIKIKSEKPDILQLCHLLTNQVLNLGTGVVWPM